MFVTLRRAYKLFEWQDGFIPVSIYSLPFHRISPFFLLSHVEWEKMELEKIQRKIDANFFIWMLT